MRLFFVPENFSQPTGSCPDDMGAFVDMAARVQEALAILRIQQVVGPSHDLALDILADDGAECVLVLFLEFDQDRPSAIIRV